jgi:RNA-directed DNA polymerase
VETQVSRIFDDKRENATAQGGPSFGRATEGQPAGSVSQGSRSYLKVIEEVSTVLIGWQSYFKLTEVKNVFEKLDHLIRRKLRCIKWRQWKRPYTRAKNLMKRGLDEARSWKSATNGRGAWWNAGASHMNEAFKKIDFDKMGLASQLDRFMAIRNQPRTDVYGTVRTVV